MLKTNIINPYFLVRFSVYLTLFFNSIAFSQISRYVDSNGEGYQTDNSGGKYIGQFLKNKKHGQGTYSYGNGAKFEGEWRKNRKYNGVYTFSDGAKLYYVNGVTQDNPLADKRDEKTKIFDQLNKNISKGDRSKNKMLPVKNIIDIPEISNSLSIDFDEEIFKDLTSAQPFNVNAEKYFNKALDAYLDDDLKESLKNLNKSLEEDPNYSSSLLLKGRIFEKTKDYTRALDQYKKGSKVEEPNASIYFALGYLYGQMGEHELAIKNYLLAIEIQPKFPEAYNNIGVNYVMQNKISTSINYYNLSLNQDSLNYIMYYNLGIANFKRKTYESAINNYQKSIKLNSNFAKSQLNLGVVYFYKKDYKTAIEHYNKAIVLDSENHLSYFNSGIAHRMDKNYKMSLNSYNKSLVYKAANEWAFYGKARCFEKLGEYQNSIEQYEKVMEISPTIRQVYVDLAQIYYKHDNQYQKSIKYFHNVVLLDSTDAFAFAWLGRINYKKEDYSQAMHFYNLAIKYSPNYVWPHVGIGNCYRKMGENNNAIEYYNIALEKDSTYYYSYFGLAMAYNDMDQTDLAIKNYVKYNDSEPCRHAGRYNLGIIYYFDLGDKEKGIELWIEATSLGSESAMTELEKRDIAIPELIDCDKKDDIITNEIDSAESADEINQNQD